MSVRHIGQPRACCSSCATHDAQNRWCPHGTKASRASRPAKLSRHKQCAAFHTMSFPAFPVLHFPPLQSGAAFSGFAFSASPLAPRLKSVAALYLVTNSSA